MEDLEWNTIDECKFLEAMMNRKPVGINKWFHMLLLHDKFTELTEKDVKSEFLWAHLKTMYNYEALEAINGILFPNHEIDFELPDTDFAVLKELKMEEEKKNLLQKGRETPKNLKEVPKKEDKAPNRTIKEVPRRDSKDGKTTPAAAKKEVKREPEKLVKPIKGRTSSTSSLKDELPVKPQKSKGDEAGRPVKRPTRGSLKPEEIANSGKASPVPVTAPGGAKRRRI